MTNQKLIDEYKAYEPFVIARAEGKTLQYKTFTKEWRDIGEAENLYLFQPHAMRIKPTPITLTLTPEEAKVLQDICSNIGGSRSGTRGYVDSIGKKIQEYFSNFSDVKISLVKEEKHSFFYYNP